MSRTKDKRSPTAVEPGPPAAKGSPAPAEQAVDLPLHIEIGPIIYTVVLNAQQAGNDYGQTNPIWAQIIVTPNQATSQMRDTILHEVLHLLCDHIGANRGGESAILPDKESLEERLVSPLSTALLDVLRRNPELVAFLLSDAA